MTKSNMATENYKALCKAYAESSTKYDCFMELVNNLARKGILSHSYTTMDDEALYIFQDGSDLEIVGTSVHSRKATISNGIDAGADYSTLDIRCLPFA